jgi:5-methylcytosine-specific restriction enzyme subunit McrC
MTLILLEERYYTREYLHREIAGVLGERGGPDEVHRALQALLDARVARASMLTADERTPDDDDSIDLEDKEEASLARDGLIRLFSRTPGGKWKVRSLVGSGSLLDVGLDFEVLPKFADRGGVPDVMAARRSLRRMWALAADISPNTLETTAGVEEMDQSPLHEWLVARFLGEVEALLRRGIRLRYVEREENLTTVRGRPLPIENLRHNTFAPHRFFCRYEDLSPDRPENRLIRSALSRVARWSTLSTSRRRAAVLEERLHEVPRSRQIDRDFAAWQDDRLMAHYREIRQTCRWILKQEGLTPIHGPQSMIGCFARMHQVFERYVARWLAKEARRTPDFARFEFQEQKSKPLYQWLDGDMRWKHARPDIVVLDHRQRPFAVLDTKWKRIDWSDPVAQGDVYQMVAYAKFWLPLGLRDPASHRPTLALIYPTAERDSRQRRFRFNSPLGEVECRAIEFRLPMRGDGPGAWDEGFDLAAVFERALEGQT